MQMVQNDDGSLGPVTAGSTQPVAMVVHHAGIVRVKRYSFSALASWFVVIE